MTKCLLSTLTDEMVVALHYCKVVVMITLRAVRMKGYFSLRWRALQREGGKIGPLNSPFKSQRTRAYMADLMESLIPYSHRDKPAKSETQHLIVQFEEVQHELKLQIHQLEEH